MNKDNKFIGALEGPDDWDDCDIILVPIVKHQQLALTLIISASILSWLLLITCMVTFGVRLLAAAAFSMIIILAWYGALFGKSKLQDTVMQWGF